MKTVPILVQELTAVVMSSPALRRLDLSNCIRRIPSGFHEEDGSDNSGLLEAIYPLSINQNTNLDWIRLNGVHLSQTDIDFLVAMLEKPQCVSVPALYSSLIRLANSWLGIGSMSSQY
jgi:hypothetical protein